MNLIPNKTEFSEEEHVQLRETVQRIKADAGLSEAELCRQADLSASVVNSYLKAKYTGQNDPVAAKLHRWVESRRQANDLRRRMPTKPPFQLLGVSRMIAGRLDFARLTGQIVMVTGVPGAGKTATAQQYALDHPRTYLATMDPATRGVPTMLLAILEAMGITDVRGTPMQLSQRVVAKAMEAESLLIVDEAQHLSEQAIEQLRSINDKTEQRGRGLGIALLGNEEANAKIGPTGIKPVFAQVSSRVASRKYIDSARREDVVLLANAWASSNDEVLGRAELDFLVEIALLPGGLRNVRMTFQAALLTAIGRGEPLELIHLQRAYYAITNVRAA